MRCLSRIVALTVSALALAAGAAEPPDRIYVNARVWTGEPTQPEAEAFAVSGDRFVAVGTDKDVRALAGPRTVVTDLEALRVVPGFNDAHWHLPSRRSARLDGAGSVEVIQRRLIDYSRTLPAGSWVVGRGWMPTDFPNRTADRRYLDAVLPDRPVVIRDRDGHQALANTPALKVAGITRETPDPPDGWIERGPDGEPTGPAEGSGRVAGHGAAAVAHDRRNLPAAARRTRHCRVVRPDLAAGPDGRRPHAKRDCGSHARRRNGHDDGALPRAVAARGRRARRADCEVRGAARLDT